MLSIVSELKNAIDSSLEFVASNSPLSPKVQALLSNPVESLTADLTESAQGLKPIFSGVEKYANR